MAAIANIVLADALGTPVNHTFEPARSSADFAQWEDRSSTYYIGYNKITMQLKRPSNVGKPGERNLRVHVKIETPKLETVTNSTISGIAPAPTVSYRLTKESIYVLPERCALQDRKDIRKFGYNLENNQFVIDLVESLTVAY